MDYNERMRTADILTRWATAGMRPIDVADRILSQEIDNVQRRATAWLSGYVVHLDMYWHEIVQGDDLEDLMEAIDTFYPGGLPEFLFNE